MISPSQFEYLLHTIELVAVGAEAFRIFPGWPRIELSRCWGRFLLICSLSLFSFCRVCFVFDTLISYSRLRFLCTRVVVRALPRQGLLAALLTTERLKATTTRGSHILIQHGRTHYSSVLFALCSHVFPGKLPVHD